MESSYRVSAYLGAYEKALDRAASVGFISWENRETLMTAALIHTGSMTPDPREGAGLDAVRHVCNLVENESEHPAIRRLMLG